MKKMAYLILFFNFFAFCQTIFSQQKCGETMSPMFGLTTEEVLAGDEKLDKLNSALDKIKSVCIPTLRVVFQPYVREKGESDSDFKKNEKTVLDRYVKALEKIRGRDKNPNHAFILGLLVDSFHYKYFDKVSLAQRATDYAEALNELVDVWEVGNEVNGNWLEVPSNDCRTQDKKKARDKMRECVAFQINSAYTKIAAVYAEKNRNKPANEKRDPKFALNLYFNDDNILSEKFNDSYEEKADGSYQNCRPGATDDCGEECQHNDEMFTWYEKYLKKYKLKFNYVLFSYYKDDCCNVLTYPEFWVRVFSKLSKDLTVDKNKPKVGFGEVGPQCACATDDAGKPFSDKDESEEAVLKKRTHICCRLQQIPFVRTYYGNLHSEINRLINKLPRNDRPDFIGGFFYWYFYQDATFGDRDSEDLLNAFIEEAKGWK